MKRVLIPTDFSSISDNAIEYAHELSNDIVQEVVILHANAKIGDEFIKLNKEVNRLFEKFRVEIINTEKPFNSEMINEIVRDKFIDFMIMGTSGDEGSLGKKIFGSNTSSIIDDLKCPLIAVPPHYKNKGISTIGYASDFTDLDKEMKEVIAFAKMFNASVEVLHVVPVYPDIYDTEKINIEVLLDEIKIREAYPKIDYVREETFGDNQIRKGIELFTEHTHPDLMVMFHEKREGIDKLFAASATERVLTHLEVPLLVLSKFA